MGQVALRAGMLDNLIDLTAEQLIQRHSPMSRKELGKFTRPKKLDLIKEALTQEMPESSNAITEFFDEIHSARSRRNEIVHRTWRAMDSRANPDIPWALPHSLYCISCLVTATQAETCRELSPTRARTWRNRVLATTRCGPCRQLTLLPVLLFSEVLAVNTLAYAPRDHRGVGLPDRCRLEPPVQCKLAFVRFPDQNALFALSYPIALRKSGSQNDVE